MSGEALTASAILGAKDLKQERVDVPEWGGYVFVATMTGLERDAWEARTFRPSPVSVAAAGEALHNVRAALAAETMRDDKGNRLFTPDQALELGRKSGAALDRVASVAQRLNRLGEQDLEELAGNSAGAPGGAGC